MYNLRVIFARGREMKFISHLDLMNIFERALRRSQMPIAYSKGFNPRPKLVFGLPLAVGVTSDGEYVDIMLDEKICPHFFIEKINSNLPIGLRLKEAEYVEGKDNAMSSIKAAVYDLTVCIPCKMEKSDVTNLIREMFSQDEIIVEKKTRKKTENVNIKPMILDMRVKLFDETGVNDLEIGHNFHMDYFPKRETQDDNGVTQENYAENEGTVLMFSMLVCAGSRCNLKIDLFVQALRFKFNKDIKICNIHRRKLFTEI